MYSQTRITLLDDTNEKFFGEGPLRLLRLVSRTGSLRAAAAAMGMAYTKALKLIRHAEEVLGFPLTQRVIGGKDGGGSTLTPEAERWLSRFEAFRADCVASNQALYRRHFPKIGCVIMASGLSRRFGRNKLLADFGGEPMLLRILDATDGLMLERVVVTRSQEVTKLCRSHGIRVVEHDLPGRNDTVRLGLEALGDMDACLFCPGDQPLLRRQTVASLLRHWESDREHIWRPVCDGSPGSPVLFPAWAFDTLRALPSGMGGGAVLRAEPDRVRTVPVSDAMELADADTPEALDTLLRHWRNTP